MTDILSERALVAELQKQTSALGLNVHADAEQGLRGEAEKIGAKWWLGGRKVAYRMSCRPTESDHTVHFRESVSERSWGIPPPTLTVETTSVSALEAVWHAPRCLSRQWRVARLRKGARRR